jgi:hypothetical protein
MILGNSVINLLYPNLGYASDNQGNCLGGLSNTMTEFLY